MGKLILALESKIKQYEKILVAQANSIQQLREQVKNEKNHSKFLMANLLYLKGQLYTLNQQLLRVLSPRIQNLFNQYQREHDLMAKSQKKLDSLFADLQTFEANTDQQVQILKSLQREVEQETQLLDSFIKGIQNKNSPTLRNLNILLNQYHKQQAEHHKRTLNMEYPNVAQQIEQKMFHKEIENQTEQRQPDRRQNSQIQQMAQSSTQLTILNKEISTQIQPNLQDVLLITQGESHKIQILNNVIKCCVMALFYGMTKNSV